MACLIRLGFFSICNAIVWDVGVQILCKSLNRAMSIYLRSSHAGSAVLAPEVQFHPGYTHHHTWGAPRETPRSNPE